MTEYRIKKKYLRFFVFKYLNSWKNELLVCYREGSPKKDKTKLI